MDQLILFSWIPRLLLGVVTVLDCIYDVSMKAFEKYIITSKSNLREKKLANGVELARNKKKRKEIYIPSVSENQMQCVTQDLHNWFMFCLHNGSGQVEDLHGEISLKRCNKYFHLTFLHRYYHVKNWRYEN